jgi:hypothetical protein
MRNSGNWGTGPEVLVARMLPLIRVELQEKFLLRRVLTTKLLNDKAYMVIGRDGIELSQNIFNVVLQSSQVFILLLRKPLKSRSKCYNPLLFLFLINLKNHFHKTLIFRHEHIRTVDLVLVLSKAVVDLLFAGDEFVD